MVHKVFCVHRVTLQGLKGDATADVIVNDDGSLNLADLKIDDWSFDKITVGSRGRTDEVGRSGVESSKLLSRYLTLPVSIAD